jgi:hypothetical protein
VYPRNQECIRKYFILRSSHFETLLGVGFWFFADILGQDVYPVLKGQTVQGIHRNVDGKTTKQRRPTFRKTEDVTRRKPKISFMCLAYSGY